MADSNVSEQVTSVSLKKSALIVIVGPTLVTEFQNLYSERIAKGVSVWDSTSAGVEVSGVLRDIVAASPAAEELAPGEKAVHYQTDALTVDVLLNARCQTVCSKVRDVLLAGTSYVHVVYSGHVVAGSGDWLLEDDVFTAHKFLAPFKFSDVDDALKACPDATLILNTPATTVKSSEWTEDHLKKNGLGQLIKVKVNHETEASVDGATEFSQWISGQVYYTEVKDLLPSTDVVGNIRFSRPTIYIFPCGHGDSTFFGISGFNLLINGGYGRQAAFWNFVRHVDRIDGLLVTHVDTDNLWGLTSLFEKKTQGLSHPELGVVYLNAPDKTHKPAATPTDAGKSSGLVVSVPEASSQLVDYIHQIGRTPLSCVGKITSQHTIEPINLYHKIGHGSLDMYVVNPIGESKDVKELYAQWQKAGGHFSSVKLPTKGGFKDINVPLPRLVSVSVMLVWRPTAADEAITRILLPGATPQSRLFEGLDHLRSMDILQHAQCTAHSLAAAKVVKKPPTPAASAAPPARATTPAPAPATAKSAPTPAKAAPAATPAKAPLSARATPGATPAKAAAPAATPAKTSAPAAKPPAKTPAPKSAPAATKKEDKLAADKKSTVDKPASAGAKPAAAKDVRKSTAAAKPAASKTTTKAASPAEPATVTTPAPVAVINDDKPQDDAGVSSPAADVEAAPEKESTPEPAAEPAAGGDALTEVSPAHENGVDNGHEGGVENGTADATVDEVPQGLPAMSRNELADIGVYDEHDQQQSADLAIQPEGLPLPEHDADLQGEETFDPLTAWGQPSGLPAPVTDKKTTTTSKSTAAKTPAAKKTDLNQSLPAKVGSAEAADSDQGAAADNNGDIKKAMPPPAGLPRKPRASAAASTRPDRSSSAEGHDSKARPQSAATSAAAAAKRPATSGPAKPLHPVYVDLTYIPSHADAGMVDVDFFKRVRARHYVLSSSQVDPAVLDMLVEGKASWGDAASEVTVIPTYDSDTLIQWMALRKDDLDRLNIDVAPSANRCTIQLQDHTTSCSAFRLEF